ncbi:hypothetical protein [Ectothiorhodospira sp. BSL-9]|uniref:hypothetical protein n=1 Tax=Ectothiorhodospira sp. BSL-9 TaxID=1442136 RepID=UPI0012E7FFEE|nr:hypothetical protein [Ectothiorhodospira sp. BSL-9]
MAQVCLNAHLQRAHGGGVPDHRRHLVRSWLQWHRRGRLATGVCGVLLVLSLAQAAEPPPEGMVPVWWVNQVLGVVAQS